MTSRAGYVFVAGLDVDRDQFEGMGTLPTMRA